jgi:hypothetical protein
MPTSLRENKRKKLVKTSKIQLTLYVHRRTRESKKVIIDSQYVDKSEDYGTKVNDRLCFLYRKLDIARKSSHKEMVTLILIMLCCLKTNIPMDVCSVIKTVK